MTKHFCEICEKEISRSFIGHDVLHSVDVARAEVGVIVTVPQSATFVMVCEQCLMKILGEYFIAKSKKLNSVKKEKCDMKCCEAKELLRKACVHPNVFTGYNIDQSVDCIIDATILKIGSMEERREKI